MSTVAAAYRGDAKVIGWIGVAHFLSHLFQFVIPPLFLFIKQDFETGYAGVGFSVTLFFLTSGLLQTPAGFMVDRFGGRRVLLGGLFLVTGGVFLAGLAPSYWLFTAAMIVGGMGNSVFHPADYSILNARVRPERLGQAFGLHGVGGSLGYAVAPPLMLGLAAALGWRGAVVLMGAVGLLFALALTLQRDLRDAPSQTAASGASHNPAKTTTLREDLRILLAAPILLTFAFFVLMAFNSIGIQSFGVPGMVKIYDVSLVMAGSVLTTFLFASVAGQFTGGFVASRTSRRGTLAAVCVLMSATCGFSIGTGALPAFMLMPVLALGGLLLGIVQPIRDVIVREIAPPEARGKVYGFVYSGLDTGASIAPGLIGLFLDWGWTRGVFLATSGALLLAAATLATLSSMRR